MSKEKVLAKVNGKEITEKDLNILIQSMGPQRAMQFQSEEGKKELVNELINQELVYLDAIENKMNDEEAFNKKLEDFAANLLKQYYLEKLLTNVEVSEEKVKEYYENNKDKFISGEKYKASHILVDEEEKAEEILKEIKEGKSFEEAAKEYSSCPSKDKGGDLGYFGKGQMVKEFEEAAEKAELDVVVGPVKTQFGYHLILVTDKKESETMSFEEVKGQLKGQLMNQRQKEVYDEKMDELKAKYDVEKK